MGGVFSTNPVSLSDQRRIVEELERTRIRREIALHEALEKRKQFYKLAEEREKLNWSAAGGALASVLCALSSFHHKNLLHLTPVAPIATFIGYKAHLCYGPKIELITKAAEELWRGQTDSLSPFPVSEDDVLQRMREVAAQKADDAYEST